MNTNFKIVRIDVDGANASMVDERSALVNQINVDLDAYNCVTEEEIIAAAQDADVIITENANISRRVLESLLKCKAVIRYGVGYDTVDVGGATDNRVMVINVPDFCGEEVSNHVMTFLLGYCKKLILLNALTKKGRWAEAKSKQIPMGSIYNETLGIIGCGNLGRFVARKAIAFNMNVIGYDKYLPKETAEIYGIKLVSLEELLSSSDYITLHVALTEETKHMIGEKELNLMKPSCVLINTSRGPVVDEKALIIALNNNQIAGACLDVFEIEPAGASNPLLSMENVIVTPHCASYSDAAFRRLRISVIKEALRIKNGERPISVVNKSVKPKVVLK